MQLRTAHHNAVGPALNNPQIKIRVILLMRAALAPLRVPATIACDGVIPSSTRPSIAMIVPLPWSCSSNFGVRVNSGAAAQ